MLTPKRLLFALICSTTLACGDENSASTEPLNIAGHTEQADTDPDIDNCIELSSPVMVSGTFYEDADLSERSAYTGGMTDEDPLITPNLIVMGAASSEYEISTCDDGRYEIGGLADGSYLIAPNLEDRQCSTNNCSRTFAKAMQENGSAVVVTFGDSLAVYGERPLFPERFASLMAGIGEIQNRNVAVSGSTSSDWLPNGNYFRNRLSPHLESAELIVITIGGNDFAQLINNAATFLANPSAAAGAAREAVQQAIENLKIIITAIREVNPEVDIAFCLYPDYTQATGTIWSTINNFLGQGELSNIITEAREAFPNEERNLILVDVFGAAQGLSLKEYLYTQPNGQVDPLHFSAKGQVLYAEELFKSVGGILLGDSPLGELGNSPLGTDRDFGFTPQ